MALTIIAVASSILAVIATAAVFVGLMLFLGRDRSYSHPSINEMLARDDALAQNIADRLADKVAIAVENSMRTRSSLR